MTESRRGVDYVATYLYPWACERNQIKRPESINIDRLRKQLKRKRESFEKSFTRIEMTKEHLNEIMASLCKKLMIDKSDLVAIHEAALVALGIDSNAVPYGLDFLVLRGLGDAGVSKLSIDGFDIRLHAPENFEANGPISLVAPRGMDFPSLAPETILETISKSPSCRYLMEQRLRWRSCCTSTIWTMTSSANLPPMSGRDFIGFSEGCCHVHRLMRYRPEISR